MLRVHSLHITLPPRPSWVSIGSGPIARSGTDFLPEGRKRGRHAGCVTARDDQRPTCSGAHSARQISGWFGCISFLAPKIAHFRTSGSIYYRSAKRSNTPDSGQAAKRKPLWVSIQPATTMSRDPLIPPSTAIRFRPARPPEHSCPRRRIC
jgi:hypothetical protein